MIPINTILSFINTVEEFEQMFRGVTDQKIYVREEIAEVLKEFSKEERGKGCPEHIIDEEIDLIDTLFVDLRRRKVSFEQIFSGDKLRRAISRYKTNEEV